MQRINHFVNDLNGVLFSEYVVYALLFTGVLFTIWSGFGQYRALTHGVAVIRGKYDRKGDPGAINHFQALSTALSATVGLGNIAGVAVAVALGGPGAILWMWVIGVVGMALKMTEVTQSMLYRDTSDPENPHGGPMFVVREGLAKWGMRPLGSAIGGVFVITLIISAITGGNMFQAWNVADITHTYFQLPQVVPGIILTVLVGLVIIGGIKRIGAFAGRVVPFMCLLYLVAGLYVIALHLGEVPRMLALIVRSGLPDWLGGSAASPEGAFLGGTFGYAAMWGIKRALFSSEAGQGSAPIAHSAAKTDEPVREGVVAGLEPFIDTLVVCTLTALVILSTGAYNRDAEGLYTDPGQVVIVQAGVETSGPDRGKPLWTIETTQVPARTPEAKRIVGARPEDAGWRPEETVFMVVHADADKGTGRDLRRIPGRLHRDLATGEWSARWGTVVSEKTPEFNERADGTLDLGIYGDYAGASLTAHAFDRAQPGLGKWLVTIVAWLFALSTIISWSYYGEQGVVYLFRSLGKTVTNGAVMIYKLIYCFLILFTTIAAMPILRGGRSLIGTDAELDMWTTLGLGVMLVANIPIMLIFGPQAMKAYHGYMAKLKRREFHPHDAPPIVDVAEGKSVE